MQRRLVVSYLSHYYKPYRSLTEKMRPTQRSYLGVYGRSSSAVALEEKSRKRGSSLTDMRPRRRSDRNVCIFLKNDNKFEKRGETKHFFKDNKYIFSGSTIYRQIYLYFILFIYLFYFIVFNHTTNI